MRVSDEQQGKPGLSLQVMRLSDEQEVPGARRGKSGPRARPARPASPPPTYGNGRQA